MSGPTKINRRKFIQGAAVATAAPLFVPSSVFGAGGRAAPSNRLNYVQIGIGNQGSGHCGWAASNSQLQFLGVCDVNPEHLNAAKSTVDSHYGNKDCKTYDDFREILARPDIDLALIAVPDHWHALISIAALEAGKDVYCEKPLTLTIRQADALVATARRYGRVFQTGSQQRSDGRFRLACELVRNHRIGDLKSVHVGLPNNGQTSTEKVLPEEPIPPGFDYNMWLGPAPWNPYNNVRVSGDYGGGWRYIRDYSGGMMTDWGAHHFDIAQWGMGMDDSGPSEIYPADGANYKTLTYKYANGVTMSLGGTDAYDGNGILFKGTDGEVFVNRSFIRSNPEKIVQQPIGPNDIHLYDSPDHHQNWLDCVRTRQRPICDVAIGASSVTVCHLGNIATWLGRPIKWDPEKRVIVGDADASRWLDRPMRAPWRLT